MKTLLRFWIFALCIFAPLTGLAFDVDGFQSGMSLDRVKSVLVSGSFTRIEFTNTMVHFYDPSGKDRRMILCYSNNVGNNRGLVAYEKYFEPTFKNFFSAIRSLRKQFGKPANVGAFEGLGVGVDLPLSYDDDTLEVIWDTGQDEIKISYSPKLLYIAYRQKSKD